MADNTVVSPSGDNMRTKDRGSAKTQIVQIDKNTGGAEDIWNGSTGLPVSVADMPGAGPTTDWLAASLDTSKISNGLVQLTPKWKSVAVAASQTDSSVIAAVTSKKLRVLTAAVQVGGTATDITFESDDASADTQVWKLTPGVNGGMALPFSPVGWFETDAGEALIVTTGSGSTSQILLTYIEV